MGYVTKEPEKQAVLRLTTEPLWSRVQIAVTATQQLSFFSTGNSGDNLVSNMEQGAQLGSPNEFNINGIGFHPAEGTPLADLQKLYNSAVIALKFGSQERVKLPLFLVPNPAKISGAVSTTETSTSKESWGLCSPFPYYPLSLEKETIKINSLENFSVSMNIAAGSAFSAAFYGTMVLFGIFGKGQ